MTRKYFGTDGIRGRVGEGNITPEFVQKLGWAAGRVLGKSKAAKVIIGKDTRISGYIFESALESGFSAAGVDVSLMGPMPTPGVAYLARTFHADAGVVISASHNPYYDNGIKFFSGDGVKLPDEVELAIEAEMDKPMTLADQDKLGKAIRIEDARGRYIEFCKSSVPFSMNLSGLKIVVDCAHGATYQIAPEVFSEIGADVITIGDKPNGLNINDEVGATAPKALRKAVLEHEADLGVALDGDGDRLIMVDHDGRIIDGDEVVFIIARARHERGKMVGNVVGTLMSNLGLEVALRDLGIGFERTKVGDRYIMERLAAEGWILGGESSGHIICTDRTTTGDGVIAALQVLAEMDRTGKTLKDLASGMTKYPQELINVKLGKGKAAEIMENADVQAEVAAVETEMGDEGRVLLRPSGTEPLIRVMVEGVKADLVRANAERIAAVVEAQVA